MPVRANESDLAAVARNYTGWISSRYCRIFPKGTPVQESPSSLPGKRIPMPRYTILTHDHPVWHWDFLLDPGGEELLLSWRIRESPDKIELIAALRQFDHRRLYLDYVGPISGNRGSVAIWDQGEYEVREGENLRANSIRISCLGSRIKGEILLKQLDGDDWEYAYFPMS